MPNSEHTATETRRDKWHRLIYKLLKGTHDHYLFQFPPKQGLVPWLLKRFFNGITIDERHLRRLRELPAQSIVVYTTKYRSQFEYLFYHSRYQKEKVPVPELGFGLRLWLLQPLSRIFRSILAHLDGLVLPLLVGAWWARQRHHDALCGALLGLAAAYKLYPALLFPALWRPDHKQGRWQMPAAFLGVLVASYLPAVLQQGSAVIGFLPNYLRETFNLSPLVQAILAGLRELNTGVLHGLGLAPLRELALLLLGGLALLGLYMLWRPAQEGETAMRRSLWLMGVFALLSHDLFSWYLLWLLPLLAIFLQPARLGRLPVLRADAWTGWWLFCGLAALSYTFFIRWRPVAAATWAQFLPLYAFLLADGLRQLYQAFHLSPPWQRLADHLVRG